MNYAWALKRMQAGRRVRRGAWPESSESVGVTPRGGTGDWMPSTSDVLADDWTDDNLGESDANRSESA